MLIKIFISILSKGKCVCDIEVYGTLMYRKSCSYDSDCSSSMERCNKNNECQICSRAYLDGSFYDICKDDNNYSGSSSNYTWLWIITLIIVVSIVTIYLLCVCHKRVKKCEIRPQQLTTAPQQHNPTTQPQEYQLGYSLPYSSPPPSYSEI